MGFARNDNKALTLALACDLTDSWPHEIQDDYTNLQIQLAAGLRARLENEKYKGL